MKIVLIGASGYGAYYLKLIEKYIDAGRFPLAGVVDPFGGASPMRGWLEEHAVPLYDSLEDFYKSDTADLVIVCSPIQFHLPQSALAMKNGSAVLCEKPVTATPEEAMELLRVQEETGMPCGVGFQWSFSPTMLELKNDILSGRFGAAKRLRTLISWKRDDRYYDPDGWKGKIRDKHGNLIMDSIAMNATAHYLHNMLFLMGGKMDASMAPSWIEADTYRARDIQSYDTIFLRAGLPGGAELIYTASHAAKTNIHPIFSYEFENGTVDFDHNKGGEVIARFTDGTVKSYGYPQSDESNSHKILAMLEAAEKKTMPVCHVSTVLPHLNICKAVHDNAPVRDFPGNMIVMEASPPSRHVIEVNEAMDEFYESGRFPGEQGYAWAGDKVRVEL